MTEGTPGTHGYTAGGELRVELDRLVRRVAALGPARLGAVPADGSETAATVVHRFVQRLADAAASVEPGPSRQVPRLADHASADQLAVLSRELLAVADRLPEPAVAELTRAAAELRRRL